ncbi:MAG: hypothetical protein OXH15_19390, partial [Gammaproteobacteria bacterium]|nr:hypothetical protein [Gammaproteobacteria bacterium]
MLLNVPTTAAQARRDELVRAGAEHRGRDRRRWIRRAAAVVAGVALSAALGVEPAKAQLPSWLLITDPSVDEGGTMTFEVFIAANGSVPGGFKVTPTFTDGSTQHSGYGTAKNGTDYTATANPATLTFQGNARERHTFTVATTQDTVAEQTEIFTVNLSVTETTARFQIDDATAYIRDKDLSTVTIEDESTSEGSGITFRVTVDNAVEDGFTVTPSFTDVTATKGTDYTENTAGISFAGTAGESKTFTVATIQDQLGTEATETFTVNLAVSGTKAKVTASDTATGKIYNVPALSIDDASAAEGDPITFTVTLDGEVTDGLTVTPSFTDGTATKGTENADYTENVAALNFAGTAGESKTFTVATTDDQVVEGDETFTVNLQVSGATVTASDTATGTIENDDTATLTMRSTGPSSSETADASAEEGDGIEFTVTAKSEVEGGFTVTPSFTDGTATQGTDYTPNTAQLTFTGTADETKTFTVATTEDQVVEGDETFTVNLAVSVTSEPETATGTILNDDTATLTIEDASASEGDGITFRVTVDAAVEDGFTVTPSFTDVTATKGTDYEANTAALTFAGTAGESKTFTVRTTQDSVVEGGETFTVGLATSGPSATVTATDTATGTIRNDDDTPEVNLSLSPSSVREGASDT